MYKTALVLKNVHSWANWCSNDDLLSDYDALYRKFDHHTKRKIKKNTSLTLQQEKDLLTLYLHLDTFLRAHHLRHHFPHAERATQIQITSAYAKLQKAEELLMLRK